MQIHPDEAKSLGFTIDNTCYPWRAYKGERFASDENRVCYTDLESKLITQIAEKELVEAGRAVVEDDDGQFVFFDMHPYLVIAKYSGPKSLAIRQAHALMLRGRRG